jgi:omega-6 fatty acid desaturase (delta-12 desaturase)
MFAALMTASCSAGERSTSRVLIDATRPFAVESLWRSWWHALSTFAVLGALIAVAASAAAPLWLRLCASIVEALVIVRAFILYHDHLHGALLRNSKLASPFFQLFGLVVVAPARVWRETHNYHHAHTAQLVGSHIGSFPTMSTEQWAVACPRTRRQYKIARHPLTVLFAHFTAFLLMMGLLSFVRSPRKRWDSALSLLVYAAITAGLWLAGGVTLWACAFFLPLFLAHAIGAYLFYAQHNFEGMQLQPRQEWTYERAALESSSFMETGAVMGWFTGNIGYHHVHHLNPAIPFYRLPDAMAAVPELQQPGKTTLEPRDIAACFRLKLWDPAKGKMVGFPEAP